MILWGAPRFLSRSGDVVYFFDAGKRYCGWDVRAPYVRPLRTLTF